MGKEINGKEQETIRDANNYFGQTSNPFVLVSEFEIKTNSIRIVFDGFASSERFNEDDEPLSNLRREFSLVDSQFTEFAETHREILDAIRNQILKIDGFSEEYTLIFFQILITKFVIVINAEKPDDNSVRTKTAPEYHRIIEENRELVQNALSIAWQFGKTNDPFLASLS
jgi:hypothetical protein